MAVLTPEPLRDEERPDPLLAGRNETPLQRCDRNLVKLLREVRVVQTGVQGAVGLPAHSAAERRLRGRHPARAPGVLREPRRRGRRRRAAHGADRLPPHPLPARRQGALVAVSNRFTLAGLAFVGIAMLGSLLFVGDLLFGDAVMFATVVIAALTIVVCWWSHCSRRRRIIRPTASAMPRRSPDRTARTDA